MKISIHSRSRIEKLLHSFETLDNVLVISINTYTHFDGQYQEKSPIPEKFSNNPNVLKLWFDDRTEEEMDEDRIRASRMNASEIDWTGKKFKLFSDNDAQSIIEFLHKRLTIEIKEIIVHCTAGISRSGAIGSTLNDYYNRFLEDNKKDWEWMYLQGCENTISPNPHVSSIFRNALGMGYS